MIDDETRAKAMAQVKADENSFSETFNEGESAPPADKPTSEYDEMKAKGDQEYNDAFNMAEANDKAVAMENDPGVAASAVSAGEVESVALEPLKAAAPASFKATFAAQRKAGAKSFDWNGKKYSTELASKPAVASAPAAVAKPVATSVATPPPEVVKPVSAVVKYTPSKDSPPTEPAEVVRSAPTSTPASRGKPAVVTPGKPVAMPTLPEDEKFEFLSKPGSNLRDGQQRKVAEVPPEAPVVRRGYVGSKS